MKPTNEIAKQNAEVFTMRDNNQKKWMDTVVNYRKTVMDNPFDSTQQAEIQGQGLDPEAFLNIHSAIVDGFVGLMSSNKNSLTAIPRNGNINKAYLYQVILTDILMKSYWPIQHRSILYDEAVSGIGFSIVDVCDPWEKNIYNTVVRHLDFENCRWSNTYSHPFMEDLDDFVYYTNMSIKAAIEKTGKHYDEAMFENMYEVASTIPDSLKESKTLGSQVNETTASPVENQIVPVIVLYRKEYKGYLELIRYGKDKNTIKSSTRLSYDGKTSPVDFMTSYFIEQGQSPEEAKYIVDDQYIKNGEIKKLNLRRVIKQTSIGGLDVGFEELPTDKYPFTPFKFKHLRGSAPIGMIQAFDGLSRMANQAFYIEFITGLANASIHWELPNGHADPDEFKKQAVKTMGIFKTDPQNLGNGQVTELRKHTSSANPGQMMNMIQFLIGFIKNQTGIDDIISGTYSGTPPSGDMAEIMQRYSGLRFRPFEEDHQMALAHQGSVMLDFAKAGSDKDGLIRIFESDDEAIELYSKELKAVDTGFKTKEGQSLIEIPLNKDEGDELVNDVRNTSEQVDVMVVAAPFSESNRRAALSTLAMMNQQDPNLIQSTASEVFELMEIPQAKRIGKKIDQTKQVMDENEGLKKQIEMCNSTINDLNAQLVRARTTTQVTKEAVPIKSAFETALNEIDALIKEGTPESLAKAKDMSETALDDLQKIIGGQNADR